MYAYTVFKYKQGLKQWLVVKSIDCIFFHADERQNSHTGGAVRLYLLARHKALDPLWEELAKIPA